MCKSSHGTVMRRTISRIYGGSAACALVPENTLASYAIQFAVIFIVYYIVHGGVFFICTLKATPRVFYEGPKKAAATEKTALVQRKAEIAF